MSEFPWLRSGQVGTHVLRSEPPRTSNGAMMQRMKYCRPLSLLIFSATMFGGEIAHANDPPPASQPPLSQPPVSQPPVPQPPVPQPPVSQPPVAQPPVAPPVPASAPTEGTIQVRSAAAPETHKIVVEVQTRADVKPAGLVAGYHNGVFMAGGFFELGMMFAEEGLAEAPLYGTAFAWSIGLTLRQQFVASSDKRTELFGQVDIGFGENTLASDDLDAIRTTRMTYFAGIGVNLWLHPQFALGGRIGMRGESLGGDNPTTLIRTDTGLHVMHRF